MTYTEEMTTSEILLRLASMRNELLQAVNDIEKISKNICYKAEQTESNSEKPNNCEKDCFLCKWLGDVDVCGRCRNRNLFAEADTEPKPQTCYTCEYEWRDGTDEPCVYCYGRSKYKPKDEPQKHCHRPSDVACHPEQGDTWCRGCDYWYANEPQTERSE